MVDSCFSIYTSWITSGPKSNFICDNIPTKAILLFFGCSEVNSTWLITTELASQSAREKYYWLVWYILINHKGKRWSERCNGSACGSRIFSSGAYPVFYSIKGLYLFLLLSGWDATQPQGYPPSIKFACRESLWKYNFLLKNIIRGPRPGVKPRCHSIQLLDLHSLT